MTAEVRSKARIVAIAPFGRDRKVLARLLQGQGLAPDFAAADGDELKALVRDGADLFVLTAEAFKIDVLEALNAHLRGEPAWSLPPIVLIGESEASVRIAANALRTDCPAAPVSVLVRPCEAVEISSAIELALEARRRQREVSRLLRHHREGEDTAKFRFDELSHRVKNLFALIGVLGRESYRAAEDQKGFDRLFRGRLNALSQTYHALYAGEWEAIDLDTLVRGAVKPLLAPGEDARIVTRGEPVKVPSALSASLTLVFHELGSNARKYGALSNETGRVEVSWSISGTSRLELVWRERGGPPVTAPQSTGFGATVITRSLAGEGAEVALDYPASGVECRITLDLTA